MFPLEAVAQRDRLGVLDRLDPGRVETFQMIQSVALETVLPPVVEKVMRRITVLEHTNKSMIRLLDELMEALSED